MPLTGSLELLGSNGVDGIIPTSQRRKLRFREVKRAASGRARLGSKEVVEATEAGKRSTRVQFVLALRGRAEHSMGTNCHPRA